jgi:hypothetical protein
MKKHYIVIAILIIMVLAQFISSGVQTRTISTKQYKFDLKAGDRVIVLSDYEKTYIRITPTTARVFDSKVPEGKTWSGVLSEK